MDRCERPARTAPAVGSVRSSQVPFRRDRAMAATPYSSMSRGITAYTEAPGTTIRVAGVSQEVTVMVHPVGLNSAPADRELGAVRSRHYVHVELVRIRSAVLVRYRHRERERASVVPIRQSI